MTDRYVADYQDQNAALVDAGIRLADLIVNKNYLIHLDECPVVPFDAGEHQFNDIRLFHITRVIYDPMEDAGEKLISVYNSLGSFGSDVVMVLSSTSAGVDLYLGAICQRDAETAGFILDKSLSGNFPGVIKRMLDTTEVSALLQNAVTSQKKTSIFSASVLSDRHVASVSIVPSMRREDSDTQRFVQGLEKFIDTMSGEDYTAIILCSPIDKRSLELRKRGLEELYSSLVPFESISMTYGQNSSTSVTDSVSANFSSSVNQSISHTTGASGSETYGTSSSSGSSSSSSYEGFFGGTHSSGSSYTSGSSHSSTSGWSESDARTQGTSTSEGTTTGQSTGVTTGDNQSFTLTRKNKTVAGLLEQIETQLERIRQCEAFGLWECAAYFIARDVQTAVISANTYKALMTGEKSGVENSFVNLWNGLENSDTTDVLRYLEYARHPRFCISGAPAQAFSPYLDQEVSAASMVSGFEVPLLAGLPKKSVTGVTALNMAEFGRNIFTTNPARAGKKINLGRVYHMGEISKTPVALDLKSMASHCFICGSTGSGKSNTSYQLLSELHRNRIHFMVIEPAKGEYRKALGSLEGLQVYTTNPQYFQMLRLNPFSFPPQIHVLEHLDRLIEIFTACWPLYAAMPAILKSAFEMVYIRCGWDLTNSIYMDNGRSKFPTFVDLLEVLPEIINASSYSSDSKGDYTGALVTRVSSLTRGIIGQILCAKNTISDRDLFDANVVVDLSRVGSSETKSLLMGVLVLKLSEYRMSTAAGENVPLKHVTVLEEAHNLLRRGGGSGGSEGADVQGKSVEMISSAIAEIRTFGEGFIIIDQSPSAVDISAIKNTNTKIIMRLPEVEDCNAVGRSIGLNEAQIRELSRLSTGVAAVYQNNWLEPVLVQVNMWQDDLHAPDVHIPFSTLRRLRGQLAGAIIKQYYAGTLEPEALSDIVTASDLPACRHAEYQHIIDALARAVANDGFTSCHTGLALRDVLQCDQLLQLTDMQLPKVCRTEEDRRRCYLEGLRCMDVALAGLAGYGAFQTTRLALRALLCITDSWNRDLGGKDQRARELWLSKNQLVSRLHRDNA